MANKLQIKRTTVSGRTPNTTNSGNTHFIDTGELALNLTDGKMFSSNGSVHFEVGANLANLKVTSEANVSILKVVGDANVGGKLSITASSGDEGGEIFLAAPANTTLSGGITIDAYQNKIRFFEQGGSARGAYIDLTACAGGAGTNLLAGGGGSGTVTQVNTGVGLSGGPITTTGTISVVANNGIVANTSGLFANAGTGLVVNATGIHVNSSYIGTLAANSSTYVGGNTALDLRNYSDSVAGTAYSNAVANAASYSDTVAGTAYTNATSFAANATNISSGTLNASRLPATVVQNTDSRTLSGNLVISGTYFNPSSNTVLLGNAISRWIVSANTGDFTGDITGTVANMSTSVNSALLTVGTSFIANTTGAYHTGTINAASHTVGSDFVANSTAIVTTGYANIATSVNSALLTVGTSFVANTTGAYHTGTMNAASFTTTNFTANNSGVYPVSNSAGTALGATTQRWIVTANTINASGLITGSAGANISGTANLVDVYISGNLTVSGTTTYINTTTLNVGDNIVSLNADLDSGSAPTENAGLEINRGSSANVSFLWNETSDSWTSGNNDITGYVNATASVNSALITVGTSFIANTTAIVGAGYANVATSVNSALLTVGSSFIANTTGVYHTGTINAASITIGSSSFIANSTAIVIADPLTANGGTGTAGQVLTSNGSTGSPYWADASGGGAIGRVVTSYVANGSNTTFGVAYNTGYLDVYLNGIRLISGTDFTATNGTDVVFTTAPALNDNIDFLSYTQVDIAPVNARTVTNYTADGSTSTYSVTYDVGYLDVYVNGIRLSSGVDFTATSGSSVVFSTTPLSGDYIELVSNTVAPLQGNGTIRSVTYYTGDGSTSNYDVSYYDRYVDVYVNGIKYKFGDDYTASNGTGISILSTPLSGDNIEIVSYLNNVTLLDAVAKAGDTMTGPLNVPVITSTGNVSGVNGYFTTINAASHTVGSSLIANATGVYHTGVINAASHIVGSSLIANATGVYHTGTINAASITIGSSGFIANTTAIVIATPLTANGTTGTAGQVLSSNGTTGAPYWATAGGSVPNANTQVSSLGVGTTASGVTGEIRATDAITSFYSDRRLKENIKPIENAIEKVKQISGVTFNSNEVAEQYGYKNKDTQVGVIAQEIEIVLPEIVTAAPFDIGQREDGTEYSLSGENYKTVYYEKIVPLLIEAIKEQQVKIEHLESLIDKISKRI